MQDTPDDWYKHAVIYQIYPRSFADANGDGIGDLAGITSRLEYLSDLGVDAIWLSPVYQSPMADFGYDVSDYQAIDPVFGDLQDFDRLVAAAHGLGIKLLMDFVPNHTSNQHEWFKQSASSKGSDKRDWYIWKDARPDGSEPNNWQSVFGGPAWTYDPLTSQYYLHSFLKEQPDLNWANPDVQQAIQQTMRFWYDRGVDGFRVDAILFTAKDPDFRDNPVAGDNGENATDGQDERVFSHGVSQQLAAYITVMSDVTKQYPNHCLFLEAYPDDASPAGYAKLYEVIDHQVAAPFYFGLFGATYDWQAETVRYLTNDFLQRIPSDAFGAFVLGNHDTGRLANRIGSQNLPAAAVLLLTLPGTKFIYYGEELGMADVDIPAERRVDPSNVPRDPERTPMRWNSSPFAGFSAVEPWLPIGADANEHNVESLLADDTSILQLYRRLIALRRLHPALSRGKFEPLNTDNPAVYGFRLVGTNEQLVVLINLSDEASDINLPLGTGVLLVSSTLKHDGGQGSLTNLTLTAHEAVVIQLDIPSQTA